jgi:hypothetical protein
MVASRWPYRLAFRAVAINLSISARVKYFRVLATEEFTMVGGRAADRLGSHDKPTSLSRNRGIIDYLSLSIGEANFTQILECLRRYSQILVATPRSCSRRGRISSAGKSLMAAFAGLRRKPPMVRFDSSAIADSACL